jgi:hypothetical protein
MSEATGQPINGCFSPGMTLRDWFAGQALGEWVKAHIDGSVDDLCKRQIAVECYSYADAMLTEREKGGPHAD